MQGAILAGSASGCRDGAPPTAAGCLALLQMLYTQPAALPPL